MGKTTAVIAFPALAGKPLMYGRPRMRLVVYYPMRQNIGALEE
jgi:hypothetical protein